MIITIGIIIGIIILIIASEIFLFIKIKKMTESYKQLTQGVSSGNLEELLQEHLARITLHNKQIAQIGKKLETSVNSAKTHLQKVGFKRFNPFHETGGDQSFVLTILDKDDNGFILSSLHQREITRIYAKLIEKGKCKHKLSKEESTILAETLKK